MHRSYEKLVPNHFIRLNNATPFDMTTLATLNVSTDYNETYHSNYYVDAHHNFSIKRENLYKTILEDFLNVNVWNINTLMSINDNLKNNKPLWENVKFYYEGDTGTTDDFLRELHNNEDGFNDFYLARYIHTLVDHLNNTTFCNNFESDGDFNFIDDIIKKHKEYVPNVESEHIPWKSSKESLTRRFINRYAKLHHEGDLLYSYNVLVDSFNHSSFCLFPMESVIECSNINMLTKNALKEFVNYLFEKNNSIFDMLNNGDAIEKTYPTMFCQNSNLYRSYLRENSDITTLNTLHEDNTIIDSMLNNVLKADLISRKAEHITDFYSMEKYIDQCFVFCKYQVETQLGIEIDLKNGSAIGLQTKLIFWLLNMYHSFNKNHIEYFFNTPYFDWIIDEDFGDCLSLLRSYNIAYTISNTIPEEFAVDDLYQLIEQCNFKEEYKHVENIRLTDSNSGLPCEDVMNVDFFESTFREAYSNTEHSIKIMMGFEQGMKELSHDNIMDFERYSDVFNTNSFNYIMSKTLKELYDEGYTKSLSLWGTKESAMLSPSVIKTEAIVQSQESRVGYRNYYIPYDSRINPDDPRECYMDIVGTCSSLNDIIFYNIKMNVVDEYISQYITNKEHIEQYKNDLLLDGNHGMNISAILALNNFVNQMFKGNIIINKTMMDQVNMDCSYIVNFLKCYDIENDDQTFYFVFDSVEYFKKFTSLVKLLYYGVSFNISLNKSSYRIEEVSNWVNLNSIFKDNIKFIMKYRKHNNRFKMQYNTDDTEKVLQKLYDELSKGDIFTNY